MTGSILTGAALTLYERNDRLVIEAFRCGEFDYWEGVGEINEAEFFRALVGKNILRKLADTYPSPCKKHDVPVWVYLAGDISMRFHGVHPFHAFPYVVRSGGMIQALGPSMGHKAVHPQRGDVSLACEGFNEKNTYDRQTPCDQDYLRKMVPPPLDPAEVKVRSEIAAVNGLETFSSCPVPLHALVNRQIYADGHAAYWVLVDTAPIRDPAHTRRTYGLRPLMEERHRQLKCFRDLESFPSRAFSLVVHQVVFVLLTYSLRQWFLLRIGRKELNPKTRTRTLELLRPMLTVIVIYY